MFPAICYPLNFIALCIIVSLKFENGRTEEAFECRSEFIPPGTTASVNFMCCSKIKLAEKYKIFWRKYNEALGTCTRENSKVHGYSCYSSSSSDRYRTETCGPNCFAFGIVRLNETDQGEYYITLSELFSADSVKKFVLNFTTLGTDSEHIVRNPSSANTEPTHSTSSLMSCSYSNQSTTPSEQTARSHPYENSYVTSKTNYYIQTTYYESGNASLPTGEREPTSSILNIKTQSRSANTTLSDEYGEVSATNIVERNHSNVATDMINPRRVEATNDGKNTSKLLLVMVTFALLFGLITCFYTIFTKVRHCEKRQNHRQSILPYFGKRKQVTYHPNLSY